MASSSSIDVWERQQHGEDATLIAFGPDYFRGAKYGSGLGSLISFCFAYSAYYALRKARVASLIKDGTRVGNLPKMKFLDTMRFGFTLQPFFATGVMACTTTGFAKLLKFYLASGRVNEFLFDDFEFGELSAWAKHSPDAAKLFQDYCKDSLESAPGINSPDDVGAVGLTAKLIAKHGEAKRDLSYGDQAVKRHPTFGDGVAVGLFGSIIDCHLPVRPVHDYFDWKFGTL